MPSPRNMLLNIESLPAWPEFTAAEINVSYRNLEHVMKKAIKKVSRLNRAIGSGLFD